MVLCAAGFAAEALSADVPQVAALRETAAVGTARDAADDPAIWVDRAEPANSRIIGTDKKAGLYVYDLSGAIVQYLPEGKPNNVDLREDFPFADGPAPVVAVSDRADQSIGIYRFDPKTRTIDPKKIAAIPSGLTPIYGFCLYKSPAGVFYAVATSKSGTVRQWRLTAGAGGVTAEQVRSIELGSIAEGLVADDETGWLYVAEENTGIWKIAADPAKGDERKLIAKADGQRFVADIEGLAIYAGKNGSGYLIASIQGNSTYAVFERGGDNAYLGSFSIGPGKDADGTSDTDGIEASAADLGPDWPGGVFIAQDGSNTGPAAAQDFKLVPFAAIEAALRKP